jgi:hypothetical protein
MVFEEEILMREYCACGAKITHIDCGDKIRRNCVESGKFLGFEAKEPTESEVPKSRPEEKTGWHDDSLAE